MERKTWVRRYSRVMQKLGLGSVAVGIFAAVARAWITHWLGPSSHHADEPPVVVVPVVAPATVDALLHASPISLMDWQTKVEQKYDTPAQRERQFREYLGKEVIWEGYVDQIHPIPDNVEKGPGSILVMQESLAALHSTSLLGPPFVRCWCPPETAQKLGRLPRGEWIVIRGRLTNPLLAGTVLCTDLENCELVARSPVRNVETALETAGVPVRR